MPVAQVRAYVAEDAEAVAGLLSEMGYATSPQLADQYATRFTALPSAALLVAADDEAVIGLIAMCLVPRLDDECVSCRITDLVVARSHRRQGVGTRLMRVARAWARARGAKRMDLSTGTWRSEANAFYERLGFQENARALTLRFDERPRGSAGDSGLQ